MARFDDLPAQVALGRDAVHAKIDHALPPMVDDMILHRVQVPPVGDLTSHKLGLLEEFGVGYTRDRLAHKTVKRLDFVQYLLLGDGLGQVTAVFVGVLNTQPLSQQRGGARDGPGIRDRRWRGGPGRWPAAGWRPAGS